MAVTAYDIATTLGAPTPVPAERETQWQMWIDDALLQVRLWAARSGYDYATLDQQALDYVVREAVALKVRRPDSATQVDVQVDDGSVSRRYASSTGQVTILPEWWDLLRPVSAASSSGAFSIRLAYEPDARWT